MKTSFQRNGTAATQSAPSRPMALLARPGEHTHARAADLLNLAIPSSMLLTVLLLAGSFMGNNIPAAPKIIGIGWLVLLAVGWWMVRKGLVRCVAIALTVMLFVVITAVTISLGTIRAPITALYVYWVILTGMFFHRSGIFIATAASSLSIGALILAENARLLPIPDTSVGVSQWINYTGLLMLTASLVYHSNRLTEKALAQANGEIEKRKQTEMELNKLTRAVDQSPASILITDLDGNIEYVNPRFTAVTGYTLDEVVGKNPRFLQSGQMPESVYQDLWRSLSAGNEWRGELVNRKKDGTLHHESVVISPIKNPDGMESHYLAVREDITERKQAEEALRVSEARHRLVADNARDVIWTMAPDGRITYISPSIEEVRGLTPAQAMQQTIEEIHPPSSQAISLGYFTSLFTDLAAGRPLNSFRGELEYFCNDGSTIWTEVMAHPIVSQGQLVEIIGVTRDISEHKRLVLALQQAKEAAEQANAALQHANAELAKIATTDVLTGIWNRRHFLEMASTLKSQASRHGHPLSLLLLDIDHFKLINDHHGHPTGDQVLIELTRRLKQAVRGTDMLARWGGEEFVLLSPGCGANEAVRLAEKLRALVADLPFADVGCVTISLGAAELQPDETIDSLFKRVDTALYEAKAAGRNTVRAG
jgi:diguanylate cyclase (GGDEF)-like protein/PAS domain S-box-containing protein